METWDEKNLPENHQFFKNIIFIALTEGTWNRKKQDGTKEVAVKWDLISMPDETGTSLTISVFSSTDKEELLLNTPYDVIAKRAVGADGTFYGYSLKGFALTGTPINKKEPQSRWQKGQKLNTKALAIQAAATVLQGSGAFPENVIDYAEIFDAWINGEYKPAVEEPKTKK